MDKATFRMAMGAAADFSVDQAEYTTPGTYLHKVLPGVTVYSAVAVAGGQGGASAGGNGGNLNYVNSFAVTPGETLAITVGAGGAGAVFDPNNMNAQGGQGGVSTISRGGTVLLTTAFNYAGLGGAGGQGTLAQASQGGGGGGAGGYAGNGGDGGTASTNTPATPGAGGAGSGGGVSTGGLDTAQIIIGKLGGLGGGVGIDGQGASGTAPLNVDSSQFALPGNAGSSFDGNSFGAGGGGGSSSVTKAGGTISYANGAAGQGGAVRLIWPGDLRQFPSTRTLSE